MIEWRYVPSMPQSRVSSLLAPTNIETIANRIVAEMEVICCHPQKCDEHGDFSRVVFCLRVSEDLFDLFFNSPYGYRGEFFRSIAEGMNANARLIRAIAPQLLTMSCPGANDVDPALARESLMACSAKVWLSEKGNDLCSGCEGEWSSNVGPEPEIFNGRWERGNDGFERYGRKAPRLSKIRVIGAFLDARYNEFIPCNKRHRARDIHQWGWS